MEPDRLAAVTSWLGDVTGCQHVHGLDDLAGATTATVHGALALFADGTVEPLVVKVYDLGIDGVGTEDVSRDASALTAASEVGLAAPRLIDADPDGRRLGHPAIVMTRLHGDPQPWGGSDPEAWVDGLAAHLIQIGSAPLPTTPLERRRPWWRRPIEAPEWTADDAMWAKVDAVLAAPLPTGGDRLIHRDYHQLNVLWHDDEVTGTVDWVNGCLGPIESDIASCRINIAAVHPGPEGLELADRFLEACRHGGLPWHPAWDLETVADRYRSDTALMAAARLGAPMTVATVRCTQDEMVRRALEAMG